MMCLFFVMGENVANTTDILAMPLKIISFAEFQSAFCIPDKSVKFPANELIALINDLFMRINLLLLKK